MLKRILSLILVGVMALSLVACGNENSKLQGKYYSSDGKHIFDFDGKGTLIWNTPEITLSPMSKFNYSLKGNNIIATYLGSDYNGKWEENEFKNKETWNCNFIDKDTIYLEYNLDSNPKNMTLSKNYSSGNIKIDEYTSQEYINEKIVGEWFPPNPNVKLYFYDDGEVGGWAGNLRTSTYKWYIEGDKMYFEQEGGSSYVDLKTFDGKEMRLYVVGTNKEHMTLSPLKRKK